MVVKKNKVLVHYFKVAFEDDPTSSDMMACQESLNEVKGVVGVEFLRTTLKVKD